MIAHALAAALVFSPAQCKTLDEAAAAGAPYNLSDTMRSLAYIESSAGSALIGDDGTSFGVAQMQLATAKVTLRRHPSLWRFKSRQTDGKIIHRLLSDQRWALDMAARHLADLQAAHGWRRALAGYNAGEAGMQRGLGVKYADKIIKHLGVRCGKVQ